MTSEIVKVEDEETIGFINTEATKERIRSIIAYQKSSYWSSSSSSSLPSTNSAASSSTSSKRCRSLFDLMRGGNTSLKRLFDMEHTSLATHFQDYSCSPVTETIPLWGSETDKDNNMPDPWEGIERTRTINDGVVSYFVSSTDSPKPESKNKGIRLGRKKLSRKRSFRRLPGFCLWRGRRRFRFRLRLKRIRVMFCGKSL